MNFESTGSSFISAVVLTCLFQAPLERSPSLVHKFAQPRGPFSGNVVPSLRREATTDADVAVDIRSQTEGDAARMRNEPQMK